MTRWAQSALDHTGLLVLLTASFPDGCDAYYYLLLTRTGRTELQDAMAQHLELELERFGHVLRSGWGKPTEDDKIFLREHYQADV